jgi:hypothetical protein
LPTALALASPNPPSGLVRARDCFDGASTPDTLAGTCTSNSTPHGSSLVSRCPQRPPVGSAVSDSATCRHYVTEYRKRGPHKKTVAAALPKTTKELLAVNSCVQYLLNATKNYRQLCRHCVIELKWQRTSSHAGVWIARSRGPAHHKNTGGSRLSGWHLIAALFLLIPASERVRDQAILGSRVAHRWLQPQLPQRHIGRAA